MTRIDDELKEATKDLHPNWRRAWQQAIFQAFYDEQPAMMYVVSDPGRRAHLVETFERWNQYRESVGKKPVKMKSMDAKDVRRLFLLERYCFCAGDEAIDESLWDVLNNVMQPKEACSDFGLGDMTSDNTFGVEIECFGLHERADPIPGGSRHGLKARIVEDLLKELIPERNSFWQSGPEYGVMKQNTFQGCWEYATPIMNKHNIGKLGGCLKLIEGMGGYVNSSCSLHVHLGVYERKADGSRDMTRRPNGLGRHEDFTGWKSIDFTKQFLVNYTLLEDKLSFLDHRIVHDSKDVYEQEGVTLEEGLQNIINARTMDELLKAQRPDVKKYENKDETRPEWFRVSRQRLKVNAVRALLGAFGPGNTIEVRHHPGTVDAQETTAWVHFLDAFAQATQQMVDAHQGKPYIPEKEEIAKLEALVDDFVKQRGGTEIVNDAVLPSEHRATDSDKATNVKRPVSQLKSEEERQLERRGLPELGTVIDTSGLEAERLMAAGAGRAQQ